MPLHKDLTGTDLHAPGAHKTQHENGGSDELSVAGLSGQLADAQPTTLALISDATAAGRALMDDADAAAQRTTLGVVAAAGGTFTGDINVPDEAYDATTWNGSTEVPTKNAVRDKIEALSVGGGSSFVGCRLTASGAQSITSGTLPALTFDGETFDTSGFHDNATNNTRITIPGGMGGYYEAGGRVEFANNTSGARIVGVTKNGSTSYFPGQMQGGVPGSGASLIWTVTTGPLSLAAGDYLELNAYQDSGGGLNTTNTREFWIKFLGT